MRYPRRFTYPFVSVLRPLAVTILVGLGSLAPAAATEMRTEDQRIVWLDDWLDEASHFAGSVVMPIVGDYVFVGAPEGASWSGYKFVDGEWDRVHSGTTIGLDYQPFAGCSNGVIHHTQVLVTNRNVSGSYQVDTFPSLTDPPYVSGIDVSNGHIGAMASEGGTVALGQPDYFGIGRVLIYEYDSGDQDWHLTKVFFGTAGEQLGSALALINGDVVVAGGPGYGDNGAIRVYVKSGDWIEYTTIESPAFSQTDSAAFGAAVAVEGPRIAVGSPGWDRPLLSGGVVADVGTVYLYRSEGLGWVLDRTVRPSEATEADQYGSSVAMRQAGLSGAVLVAGAPFDDVNASDDGAAYLWQLRDGQWQLESRLVDSNGEADDHRGATVATGVLGVMVGAPNADANGIVDQGAVLFYETTTPVFADGFESGDSTAWSDAVP